MAEAEEETRSQTGLQAQSDTVSQLEHVTCELREDLEHVTCELREDLEHERSRRLDLIDNVTRLSLEREKNRSDFAFAQLENERAQRSLRGDISELQTRADSQHREHKYLL